MFVFYVYAYLRKDGSPYYIGKGKDGRAYDIKTHVIRPPKDKNRIVFLETGLSNVGALALERRMIRWYGRKDNGTGVLRNLTDGGEGACNPSEATRQKVSKSLSGRSRPDEVKKKISEALMGHTNTPKGITSRNKGRIFGPKSAKTIEKISRSLTGRKRPPMSEEQKIKISAARLGKKRGPYKKRS